MKRDHRSDTTNMHEMHNQPGPKRRGRKIRKAITPLTPGPISADEIAQAFGAAMVPLPDCGQLDRLATIFTTYKTFFLDAEHQKRLNAHATKAGEAVRLLTENLPPLLAHHRALADAGDPFALWQANAVEKLLRAVCVADLPRIEARSNVPNVICDWRWVAAVLLPVIRPAMPPGTGIAENGPASRFLAAILPAISGDAPTAVAVATQIKKLSTGDK